MSGVRRGTGSGSGDLSGVDDADDLADDGTIVTAASAGGAGLTPRDLTPRAVRPARPRRWLPIVLVAVVAVAIVALLVNALGNASLFFKGADAAVQGRAELGAKRFRMQGAVVQDTVVETELDGRPAVAFTVVFNHVRADVLHVGNPTSLFKPGVPVVLDGAWRQGLRTGVRSTGCTANDGWYFASTDLQVKHDSSYTAANSERLEEAETAIPETICTSP